jgi:Protein of unknown function (DUF2877)
MRKLAEVRAVSIGPIASDILRNATSLDVTAVFERSFYLMAPNGIVCVALEALGPGPINILIMPNSGPQPWTGGLPAETKAVTSAGRLTVGTAFTIDLATAQPWQPPAWPHFDAAALASGLAQVKQLAPTLLPNDGLASLVLAPRHKAQRTSTAEAAAELVADLARVLPQDIASGAWSADAQRAAILLVGLGPGLTPSGDDLLGGMMLALSALGRDTMRDTLWQIIGGELDDLTVPISAMHLSAAADGLGTQAMHEMIGAVLAGDAARITKLLPTMSTIGATSGWDALAGAMLVLNAVRRDPV